VAKRVKANAAGIWRGRRRAPFKHAFEIGGTRKSFIVNAALSATAQPRFRDGAASNSPRRFASLPPPRVPSPEGFMAAGASLIHRLFSRACRNWRRKACGATLVFAVALAVALPVPASAASPPPNGALNSTDAMLKWINAYRGKPEPEALPVLVRGLSELQAFKDPETCGAYVGFIAGVLGANPDRADALIDRMLAIQPADHWVLVRAIAYSGLPNWKVLLVKFDERMPARSGMIEKYLDGKLPTLDQIAYQHAKPGVFDKIKAALKIGSAPKTVAALDPDPELIDVLWGMYLATGAYQPIGRIIKLLPLTNDKDNVDNLTTGSAAKFTLASNAVRDLHLLAMLKRAVKGQPEDIAKVLNDVIDTAENVDTARMRKESLAAIEELKQKGPDSKRELTSWGQVGQGAMSMGCVIAAATGQIEVGIPCVIGGAAYSAGLQYMSH
jgi:hypothetical protein